MAGLGMKLLERSLKKRRTPRRTQIETHAVSHEPSDGRGVTTLSFEVLKTVKINHKKCLTL